jgi:hypothetical protein
MANLSPPPKLQFFDAAGVPLVGGKLYSYAAGTTTPLATYTSAAETTFNTNPIVLNSRGEAEVWLGSPLYKFKLTTAADVEIWTVDNITSLSGLQATIDASIKAYYSASAGASRVGFIAAGAGAVARTAQDKMRDIVSVKDFGAIGNGATDDTAAIQAAVNSGARAIYFPATANGYRVTSKITVSASNQILFGDGKYSSYINLASHNFDVFELTAVGNVTIRDLGAINFGAALSGFFVNSAPTYNVTLENLYTNNLHSGAVFGTIGSSLGGARSMVKGCLFNDIAKLTGYGIIKRGTSEIFDVIDCHIGRLGSIVAADNAAGGILIEGGTAINLENLQIIGAGNNLLIQPNVDNVSHLTLDRVWCDSSSNGALFINAVSGIVTDLRAVQCWFVYTGGDGVRIVGNARDVKIAGNNQIITNLGAGINVVAGATVPGLSIQNNSIGNNTGNGITIGAGASNFAIQNNQIGTGSFFGPNANGIILNAGATDNFIITDNNVRGNTGAAISNAATGTNARIESNLGYNPVGIFGITVTASPFTYTAGASPETVFINGGAVSLVTVSGIGVFQQTNCTVRLEPFQSVVVTYTVAPSMVRSIS